MWRLHPERWLEALVIRDVSTIDERLDTSCLYLQVPAFSASDRTMLDVLTTTRNRRLTVVELKADEDIHLPLQGLDYWSRVRWHHARGEFQKYGYFPGRELSPEDPLLFLVAPTLHIHPAADTVLRYISPTSIGPWWESTNAGGTACGRSSGSEPKPGILHRGRAPYSPGFSEKVCAG